MGAYSNFIKDFPDRCNQLLKSFEDFTEYNVTLMVAIAASGLTIPHERLKESQPPHPSSDRERFEVAAKAYRYTMKSYFLGSKLWKSQEPGSWTTGYLGYITEPFDPWQSIDSEIVNPITSKKHTGTIINHLRNALAHGNIFTRGNPIDKLVFLSHKYKPEKNQAGKFLFYMVAPADFRDFLGNWFDFLQELDIPGETPAAGVLVSAAQ